MTLASGVNTHSSPGAGQGASSLLGTAASGQAGVSAPVVTAQPANQSVSAGAPVTFTAAAAGNPTPSVQWQMSADGGASWVATSSTFSASAAENGREYRAVFSNQVGSATSNVATLTVAPMATTNFSGYIAYAQPGQSFTSVTASWVVPTVSCQPGQTTWAAQWPGIGDITTVQQVGTETDCFNGTPAYWAWYEMYGDSDPAANNGYAFPLPASNYPVLPGDQMTGSVSLANSTWLLNLSDATQNWSYATQFSATAGLSQASAEWMVEDPNGCSPQCEVLSQYSPVRFTHASATESGFTGAISAFPLTAMAIVQNSATLATAGPLDQSGGAFTASRVGG